MNGRMEHKIAYESEFLIKFVALYSHLFISCWLEFKRCKASVSACPTSWARTVFFSAVVSIFFSSMSKDVVRPRFTIIPFCFNAVRS